jgi:hypothetical protein
MQVLLPLSIQSRDQQGIRAGLVLVERCQAAVKDAQLLSHLSHYHQASLKP